jgi:hypothetical protein
MWVKQAETDDGVRSGTVSTEAARIAELERENRELRRANQILKSAASFFRSGAVRHEALGVSRGGERPFPLGCRSGLSEAGGSLIWGNAGEGGKRPRQRRVVLGLPDGAGSSSEVRRCSVSELVVEAP